MTEEQRKDILYCYEQIQKAIKCVNAELNSNNIIGRKTSFEYMDMQMNCIAETIEELTNMLKELES